MRRAGSSSRSPALETPPPIATTSGSKVLIAFAMPIPSRSPSSSTARRRDLVAGLRALDRVGAGDLVAARQPLAQIGVGVLLGGGLAASASSARPAPKLSSEPTCGKLVGSGDLLAVELDADQRVAELRRRAGRAPVRAPVEDEPAADAGPDGEHDEVLDDELVALVRLGEAGERGVVVDEDGQRRGARRAPSGAARR